ncbi:MAG TPA: ZIP family metal transporter [Nitrolancea sp.]|nr:ZIP family metal transporter [Nitrolancea sp.]
MVAVLLSIATFVSTGLGGLFALHRRGQLCLIMAFSAGLLVAAALFDLLPEAIDMAAQSTLRTTEDVLAATAVGFLVFFGLDRLVHSLAAAHVKVGHVEMHDTAAFGAIAALGLVIHSFLDGFAIGSAFRASDSIGWLVALAVIGHDFGDGVSTVSLVLGNRGGLRASASLLAADALAPVLGALAALAIALPSGSLSLLLGFFAGTFLFIGASHLLPESQGEGDAGPITLAVVAGFVLMYIVTQLLGA